jgi:hypothetical protein
MKALATLTALEFILWSRTDDGDDNKEEEE